ncbi:MAG: tetratricopeptide repeat protein, partial [Verrucomicrobia bacterium]|nr:tetratricopeptide repeat protein [Verrucomicrobiota bacterium]
MATLASLALPCWLTQGRTLADSERKYLALLVITISTALVYWPVMSFGYLNLDDDLYVTGNQMVQQGVTLDGLKWAMTATLGFWQPVVWLSHMVDSTLFGSGPQGRHIMNLIIHIGNALLLFSILLSLTKDYWPSLLVACIFALHPLNVESVAWISERKGLLAAFFWLLTTLLYIKSVVEHDASAYALSLITLCLGLLSKPILMALPAVLFLFDIWPLNRIPLSQFQQPRHFNDPNGQLKVRNRSLLWNVLKEKMPYCAFVILFSFIAFSAESSIGALAGLNEVGVGARFANSVYSYCLYVVRTALPTSLALYYPLSHSPVQPSVWVSATTILFLTTLLVIKERQRRPYLMIGWLYYLLTMFPTSGLIEIGHHLTADRYAYMPTVGLFVLGVWTIRGLLCRFPRITFLTQCATFGTLLFLCVLSRAQLLYWSDPVLLWEHTLQTAGDSALVHNNLGNCYERRGLLRPAISHYRQALRLEPATALIQSNLGNALEESGEQSAAMVHYLEAVHLDGNAASAREALRYYVTTKTGEAIYESLIRGMRSEFNDRQQRNLQAYVQILSDVCVRNGQTEKALAIGKRIRSGKCYEPAQDRTLGDEVRTYDDWVADSLRGAKRGVQASKLMHSRKYNINPFVEPRTTDFVQEDDAPPGCTSRA